MDTGSQPYLGDAWVSDENLMLARYLWEEVKPARSGRDERAQPYLGDAGCRMRT